MKKKMRLFCHLSGVDRLNAHCRRNSIWDFLIFSGVGLIDKFLCFGLFGELIVTWNAMSYLTAIKDYRGIMLSFLAAIAVTFLSGALLLFLGISHVEALMAAVCIGYGIMLLWDVVFAV